MRQRGQLIRKRKIDKSRSVWLVRVQTRDYEGKLRSRSKTIHGTKSEAQRLRTKMLAEKDQGIACSSTETLNAFFDTWLEVVQPRLGDRTFQDYRDLLRRYIREPLGNLNLQDLKAMHLQAVYSKMQQKMKLAPRTIRYTNTVVKSALKYALNQDLILKNPASIVELPKMKTKEMMVLTKEEIGQFLMASARERIGSLFSFLLATGCRPNEAIGLKWADVSFDKGTVEIKRTLVWNRKGGGWKFGRPKTKKSSRLIPLPYSLVLELNRHRIEQHQERLKLGPDWEDLDLIFPSEVGTPLTMSRITRVFKRIKSSAGIKKEISVYGLRHTSATMLLLANVNPKVVSERLGHSTVTLTLDTYSHVLPTMQENASKLLGEIMFG